MNSSTKISSSATGTTIGQALAWPTTSCSNCAAPADPVAGRQLRPAAATCALRLGDERAEVAAAHVGRDDDAALAVLAADLVRARRDLDVGHRRQRHEAARARPRGRTRVAAVAWRSAAAAGSAAPQRVEVGAQVLGQAHDDVEAAVALEDLAGLLAADRGRDDVLHVGHVEAVAGQRRAVRA